MTMLFKSLLIAVLAVTAGAHPGHEVEKEIDTRRAFFEQSTSNLDHCIDMHKASGLLDRAIKRRGEMAFGHHIRVSQHSPLHPQPELVFEGLLT